MKTLTFEIIENLTNELVASIKVLSEPEQIEAINQIKTAIHRISPFKGEPVDCVLWVSADQIQANDYNPNSVAPPEMKLLAHSIEQDGYTQPVVASHGADGESEIVDGFHRTRVGKENPRVRARVKGYLPVTYIKQSRTERRDRMAATIRHNRARGVHGVMPMCDIVAELVRLGWHDDDIAKELGMDADEVLRFKQVVGLPELFKDQEYSKSWK